MVVNPVTLTGARIIWRWGGGDKDLGVSVSFKIELVEMGRPILKVGGTTLGHMTHSTMQLQGLFPIFPSLLLLHVPPSSSGKLCKKGFLC